jgi:hypothetical protein
MGENMVRQIFTQTERYLDKGALYLTQEQMDSPFLELRVKILEIQSPLSVSFRRNPPQSVYGYLTTSYQGCVYDEVECRFDYQSIYRRTADYRLIAQLLCIYYRAVAANQKSIADSNAAQGPFTILSPAGLTSDVATPIDSFRFVGLNPCVFDFEIYWLVDDTDFGTCGVEIFDLPESEEPADEGQPYDPDRNSDPNADSEGVWPEPPDDPDRTDIPEDSPEDDFGPRNSNPPPPPPRVLGTWEYNVVLIRFDNNNESITQTQSGVDNTPLPTVATVGNRIGIMFTTNGANNFKDLNSTSVVSSINLTLIGFTPA